jgi:hypothetical protein
MAKRVRRIMKEFVLTEISMVDRPAMEGALATLLKRDARPVPEIEHHADTYHGDDSPALRALAKRLDEAAARREAREQETTMQTATTDATVIRKAADDAMLSMNGFIAKRGRNVSRADAAEQWRKLNPAEFAAMQATPPAPSPTVIKRTTTVDFMKLVDQIVDRDHCPRTVAMEIARKVHHDAFVKFQSASA